MHSQNHYTFEALRILVAAGLSIVIFLVLLAGTAALIRHGS